MNDINKTEEWKDVKGYSGDYQISSKGRVKSFKGVQPRILKPRVNGRGYPSVALTKNSMSKQCVIHRLVAKAFIDNPDNKEQVNHKDAVKTNNLVVNLEWATCKENLRHASKMGLLKPPNGERHYLSKLTWDMVEEIRFLYGGGSYTQKQLGKKFNVSRSAISQLLNNRSWVV